jgi:hypothetical protein
MPDELDKAAEKVEKKKLPLHVHGWESLAQIARLMKMTPSEFLTRDNKEAPDERK